MRNTVLALAVAAFSLVAVAGIAQAAPAAPLSTAAVTVDHSGVTQVGWWGWRHHRWWCRHHPRRCGW